MARRWVLVITVCPGLMRTGSPRSADFKGQHQAEYVWFGISGALPLLSMDAERAARQIVRACARGDAEVILSVPQGPRERIGAIAIVADARGRCRRRPTQRARHRRARGMIERMVPQELHTEVIGVDPSADATAHPFGAELLHHPVGMVLGELARQRHTASVRARRRRVG